MPSLQQEIDFLFPTGTGNPPQPVIGPTFGQSEGGMTEHGLDVILPAGAPVHLVRPGTYRADLSTSVQEVFAVTGQPGQYDSYTHVDANPQLVSGQSYDTTAIVGYVDPRTSPNLSAPAYSAGGISYYSTAPHVEFGTASGVSGPGDFFGSKAQDPTAAINQGYGLHLSGGTATSYVPGASTGAAPPPPGQISGTTPINPTAPALAPGQVNPNPSGGLNVPNPFAGLSGALGGIAGVLGTAGQWIVIALIAIVFLVLLVRG